MAGVRAPRSRHDVIAQPQELLYYWLGSLVPFDAGPAWGDSDLLFRYNVAHKCGGLYRGAKTFYESEGQSDAYFENYAPELRDRRHVPPWHRMFPPPEQDYYTTTTIDAACYDKAEGCWWIVANVPVTPGSDRTSRKVFRCGAYFDSCVVVHPGGFMRSGKYLIKDIEVFNVQAANWTATSPAYRRVLVLREAPDVGPYTVPGEIPSDRNERLFWMDADTGEIGKLIQEHPFARNTGTPGSSPVVSALPRSVFRMDARRQSLQDGNRAMELESDQLFVLTDVWTFADTDRPSEPTRFQQVFQRYMWDRQKQNFIGPAAAWSQNYPSPPAWPIEYSDPDESFYVVPSASRIEYLSRATWHYSSSSPLFVREKFEPLNEGTNVIGWRRIGHAVARMYFTGTTAARVEDVIPLPNPEHIREVVDPDIGIESVYPYTAGTLAWTTQDGRVRVAIEPAGGPVGEWVSWPVPGEGGQLTGIFEYEDRWLRPEIENYATEEEATADRVRIVGAGWHATASGPPGLWKAKLVLGPGCY